MRAIVVSRPGGADVLQEAQRDVPAPGPGEALIRVAAFSLNRADLLQRRGTYPAPPGAPSDILGLEFAGHVVELGEGSDPFQVGRAVMGIVGGGAYAEYLVTRVDHLLDVPPDMSMIDAAAVPEAFITAYDALERLEVARNEWVLIHAVASGVGTAAVQLVRLRGAHCAGTSRSADKLRQVQDLGIEVSIDTTAEDFVERVRSVTANGVHAAIDLLGGTGFSRTLEALAPRGRVTLVGLTAGRACQLDLGLVLRNRLRIEGTVLRIRSVDEKAQLTARFANEVLPHFADRTLRPVVDRVFPFHDIVAAHERMESNRNVGKIVVRVDEATT